jgi:hypothetical protein
MNDDDTDESPKYRPLQPPPPITLARISFQHQGDRYGDKPAPVKTTRGRVVRYAKGMCDGCL